MNNKVVARFIDGSTVKGTTIDFMPGKEIVHVIDAEALAGSPPKAIRMRELKALFFVKDLVGDPDRVRSAEFAPTPPAAGRRVKIVFNDGEVLSGTTTGYDPSRTGFFIEPADPGANETRCYVITAATREVIFL